MDKKIFFLLFNFAKEKKLLGYAAVTLTKYSSKIFFLIYGCLLWALYFYGPINHLYACLFVPMILLFLNLFLRDFFKRPRPYDTYDLDMVMAKKKEYSFPSNHASSASIIALCCIYYLPVIGYLVMWLAFFTGISRILTGMHYPSDVLGGFTLSLVVGTLLFNTVFL